MIVLDQVPKLLGVHIAKQGFFRDLFSLAHQGREITRVSREGSFLGEVAALNRSLAEAPAWLGLEA